jgi:hypothetical protein
MPTVISGTTGISQIQDSIVTQAKLSGISAPRGWIVYDTVGSITIRSSYNVSSVTDLGGSCTQINWQTPFANTNYGCVYGCSRDNATADFLNFNLHTLSDVAAGSLKIMSGYSSTTDIDTYFLTVAAFG